MYTVKRTRTVYCQTNDGETVKNSKKGVQCNKASSSYNKDCKSIFLTYDELLQNYLCSTDHIINWLKENTIISSQVQCPQCNNPMTQVRSDRSDAYKWQCRKSMNAKYYKVEESIRKGQ